LNPEDIPRVEDSPLLSDHIIPQHLEFPTALYLEKPCDAVFTGTSDSKDRNAAPPLAILLDFMYGVAV
jgi:hypothetical protein